MARQPLWTEGRFDEALAQLEAARALDPLSPVISLNLGRHFYYTRELRRARSTYFQETLAFDTSISSSPASLLALTHFENGEPESARQQLKASPAPPGAFRGLLRYVSGATRRPRERACSVLAELNALSARRYIPPYAFATVYAGLGMREAAFEQLELAVAEHSGYLDYVNIEPTMDSLRGDPRFIAILRRIGLPHSPAAFDARACRRCTIAGTRRS